MDCDGPEKQQAPLRDRLWALEPPVKALSVEYNKMRFSYIKLNVGYAECGDFTSPAAKWPWAAGGLPCIGGVLPYITATRRIVFPEGAPSHPDYKPPEQQ